MTFNPDAIINDGLTLSDRDIADFSFTRFIKAKLAGMGVAGFNKHDFKAAGHELEIVHAAAQKQAPSHGDTIPLEIVLGTKAQRDQRSMRRDLQTAVGTQGGVLVADQIVGSSFIDLLRKNQVTAQLGATILDGLVGDVSVPKHTGASTSYWISEGSAPSESTAALGQISLTPKTLGAYTDMTRQLLMQSSIGLEDFVRRDLATVLAIEIDRVAFYGLGASGEPRGVEGRTDVNTTSFSTSATPTWGEVVTMASDIATDNALLGTIAYVTHPAVLANLKVTSRSGSEAIFVATDDGMLNGFRLLVSTQITATHLWLANWSDLIIANWGGLDILVDPFTASTTGTVRVIAFQSLDIAVRHAQSFSLGS